MGQTNFCRQTIRNVSCHLRELRKHFRATSKTLGMKVGIYTRKEEPAVRSALAELVNTLTLARFELYNVENDRIDANTNVLLSVGGDGTFLSAARIAAPLSIPILGVNLGRLGFLSEYEPDEVAQALVSGRYSIESRAMLETSIAGVGSSAASNYSLNEVCIHRIGTAMLNVTVQLDDDVLPTYWADGLLVATSSGSTAYSLSVGGPICMPDSKVLIIAPVAPHNLNVRPLIVPDSAKIRISAFSRDSRLSLSMDNVDMEVSSGVNLSITVAQFSLKRIRLEKSNFIKALNSKLFWGEDVRNL